MIFRPDDTPPQGGVIWPADLRGTLRGVPLKSDENDPKQLFFELLWVIFVPSLELGLTQKPSFWVSRIPPPHVGVVDSGPKSLILSDFGRGRPVVDPWPIEPLARLAFKTTPRGWF